MTQPALTAEEYIQRGAALYMEDKYDAAQVEFEAAIAADPNHAKAHAGLALIHSELARTQEAAKELERALELDPACAWAYFVRGYLLANDSKDAEATVEYLQASWLDPQLAWPHNGLAILSHRSKQHAIAIQEYKEAIRLAPNWATPYYHLGYVYWDQKNYLWAAAQYEAALEIKPNWAEANACLGLVCKQLAQYEDAAEAFQRAVEEDPAEPYFHFSLGETYQYQKKFEAAIAQFQQAGALQPDWPWPPRALGDAYSRLKQRKQAINSYRLALQLIDEVELAEQRAVAWNICLAHLLPFKAWVLGTVVWLFPTLLLLIVAPVLVFSTFGPSPATAGWPTYMRWLPTLALGFIGVSWFLTAWLSTYRLGRWTNAIKVIFIFAALMLFLRSPLFRMLYLDFSLFQKILPQGSLEAFALLSVLIGTAMLAVTYAIDHEEGGVIYSLPEIVALVLIFGNVSLVDTVSGILASLLQFLPSGFLQPISILAFSVAVIFWMVLISKAAEWLTNRLTDAVIRRYKRVIE